jgi:hypothetical protein
MPDEDPDPRLDELQEEIDTIRRRLPDEPGLDIPDPDIDPIYPDEGEDPPAGTP